MKQTKNLMLYLIPILLIILIPYKAKAQVDNAIIIPNLLRTYTNNGIIDATFDNNKIATIGFNGNQTHAYQMNMFFSTAQYFGYQNKMYSFSGTIETSINNKVNVVGVNILDGTAQIIGICDFTQTGIDSYIAWNAKCNVPSGLTLGNYSRILQFEIATNGGSPTNNNMFEFKINENVAMYDIGDSQVTQDLNDIKNTDISNIDKQQPDQTQYENVQQQEDQIYGFMENADIDILNIGDTSAWTWILTQMTNMLTTHQLVMSMMISVLTIGILKTLLGR